MSRCRTSFVCTCAPCGAIRREEGQTTSEYALVILAAAAVAVVLITWAHSSGKLPAFFDQIIDTVIGDASSA